LELAECSGGLVGLEVINRGGLEVPEESLELRWDALETTDAGGGEGIGKDMPC